MAERAKRLRLRLDPTACDGIGLCAHLAPTLVRVDSWGYPIIADTPLDDVTEKRARAAATACPRRALEVSY